MHSFLLTFLVFTLTGVLNAQGNWIQPGAEWDYYEITLNGPYRLHIFYSKDTVISGKYAKELTIRSHDAWPFISSNYYTSFQYVYASGDTAYYLVNGKFEMLYDFTASPNSSWDLGVDTSGLQCGKSIMTVDSVGSGIYNSTSLKYFKVRHDSLSSVYITDYIERIGCLSYLFPQENNCDPTAIPELPGYGLICYKDSALGSVQLNYKNTYSCFPYDYLGVDGNDEDRIKVFPNPVSSYLMISGDDILEIELRNISGQLLQAEWRNNAVNMSSIPGGIYFLKVRSRNEVRQFKVLKN